MFIRWLSRNIWCNTKCFLDNLAYPKMKETNSWLFGMKTCVEEIKYTESILPAVSGIINLLVICHVQFTGICTSIYPTSNYIHTYKGLFKWNVIIFILSIWIIFNSFFCNLVSIISKKTRNAHCNLYLCVHSIIGYFYTIT